MNIPQSLVLTEKDYIDFIINLSKDQSILPPAIRTNIIGKKKK
jgi:hypothetical protein